MKTILLSIVAGLALSMLSGCIITTGGAYYGPAYDYYPYYDYGYYPGGYGYTSFYISGSGHHYHH